MIQSKAMSVLRYPGGKSRAIKVITPLIPEDTEYLYSPFFGGGSIELTCAKRSSLNTVYANDKFKPLTDFWCQAQTNANELMENLFAVRPVMTKDMFLTLRKTIKSEENALERAVMYFAINRCSFSGATFSGGFSLESKDKRFTESSIERIGLLHLHKFEFSNLDFIDFFKRHEDNMKKPKHFIYADPPYLLDKGNKLYGNNGDLHENFDHRQFHAQITKFPNWIISYNDSESVRNMYKDYTILPVGWAYGMGLKSKNGGFDKQEQKKSSEILILSRPDLRLENTF